MAKLDLGPLDQALTSAHHPALCAALVQITGSDRWLKPEWKPTYTPLARGETGVPEAELARFRAEAKAALSEFFEQGRVAMAEPPPELLKRMMDFVAGSQ